MKHVGVIVSAAFVVLSIEPLANFDRNLSSLSFLDGIKSLRMISQLRKQGWRARTHVPIVDYQWSATRSGNVRRHDARRSKIDETKVMGVE